MHMLHVFYFIPCKDEMSILVFIVTVLLLAAIKIPYRGTELQMLLHWYFLQQNLQEHILGAEVYQKATVSTDTNHRQHSMPST